MQDELDIRKYAETPFSSHIGSWPGVVMSVNDDAEGGVYDTFQEITVSRVMYRWSGDNTPLIDYAPSSAERAWTSTVTALPYPVRHDQAKYNVAVGDVVMIVTDNDGRYYYLTDDLPFLARVIKGDYDATEDEVGGVGVNLISVRRQNLTGNPTTGNFAMSDMETDSTAIDYDNIFVLTSPGQQHGYRVGDGVWIQKRGLYYFATAGVASFPGEIFATGPDGEADFATNHYWVKEHDYTVTYDGDDDSWTATDAARSPTDPMGTGGVYGRWVDAQNVAEAGGSHGLSAGDVVIVHMFADPSSEEPFYLFERVNDILLGEVKEGQTTVSPVDSIEFIGGSNITITVADGGSEDATVTIASSTGTHNVLNASEHPDTVDDDPVRGDLMIGNSTPKWDRLPISGSGGSMLYHDGSDPYWDDAPTIDVVGSPDTVSPCDKITFTDGNNITITVDDNGGGDAEVTIDAAGSIGNHNLLNNDEHPDTANTGVTNGNFIVGIAGVWNKTSAIFLDGSDIGIGTESPGERLHVKHATENAYVHVETDKANGEAGVVYENYAIKYQTYITYSDTFVLHDITNSNVIYEVTTTEIIINPAADNIDFTVEDNTGQDLLFCDVSAQTVTVTGTFDVAGIAKAVSVDAGDAADYLEGQIGATGENVAVTKVNQGGADEKMIVTHTTAGADSTTVQWEDGNGSEYTIKFDANGHLSEGKTIVQ